MLDVSVSYNRYKFLGYEFLTWLWFVLEKQPDTLKLSEEPAGSETLEIGNRIVLENRTGDHAEMVVIKGDDAQFEEGVIALRKGAVVTEVHLRYKFNELEWTFTLKGESLNIAGLRTPATGSVETEDETEGAVLEKAYLIETVVRLTDQLFNQFIRLRISDKWRETVRLITQWIGS